MLPSFLRQIEGPSQPLWGCCLGLCSSKTIAIATNRSVFKSQSAYRRLCCRFRQNIAKTSQFFLRRKMKIAAFPPVKHRSAIGKLSFRFPEPSRRREPLKSGVQADLVWLKGVLAKGFLSTLILYLATLVSPCKVSWGLCVCLSPDVLQAPLGRSTL